MICQLCFHHCGLSEGQTGLCRARICRDGDIVPLNYGKLTSLARWLASVDREIPLHLSRFFPRYRMVDKLPTPVGRVVHLANVAREYLPFVYTENC